jgi:uncharacterized protein YyaL (SSP411 family)
LSIERVTAVVVERAERGDALSPSALLFLVRRYLAASEPDVSGVLGHALAGALAQRFDGLSTADRAAWLRAFAEAVAVSEDPRLAEAARDLIAGLADEWPALSGVEGRLAAVVADAAASVEACLVASHLVDAQVLVPRAIDELERIVSAVYHPGQSVGDAADHVCLASALLTAYEATGRLPYSMLAEELMQGAEVQSFAVGCDAVRVWSRLAALHDDQAYRSAAVIKADAAYRAVAMRTLEQLSTALADPRLDAARYGLALDESQR